MQYFLNLKFKINCYKIKISINLLKFVINTKIFLWNFFLDYLMITLKLELYKSEFFHFLLIFGISLFFILILEL